MILDTNAFLFMNLEPARLSRKAAGAIRGQVDKGTLAVASITLWEVAMLADRGRIRVQGTVDDWIERALRESSIGVREINPAIAALAQQFPDDYPRDPADRIIGASARFHGLPRVTSEGRIRACRLLTTIW